MMKNASGDVSDEKAVLTKEIMREVVLPAIEKEVNEGKNFAVIRQVYYAAILAKWYRELIQNTLLAEAYVGRNRVVGVTSDDKTVKEAIYQRYIAAYKKGVFNYIKEESDVATGESLPRKYFSGGISDFAMTDIPLTHTNTFNGHTVGQSYRVDFAMNANDSAMNVNGFELELHARENLIQAFLQKFGDQFPLKKRLVRVEDARDLIKANLSHLNLDQAVPLITASGNFNGHYPAVAFQLLTGLVDGTNARTFLKPGIIGKCLYFLDGRWPGINQELKEYEESYGSDKENFQEDAGHVFNMPINANNRAALEFLMALSRYVSFDEIVAAVDGKYFKEILAKLQMTREELEDWYEILRYGQTLEAGYLYLVLENLVPLDWVMTKTAKDLLGDAFVNEWVHESSEDFFLALRTLSADDVVLLGKLAGKPIEEKKIRKGIRDTEKRAHWFSAMHAYRTWVSPNDKERKKFFERFISIQPWAKGFNLNGTIDRIKAELNAQDGSSYVEDDKAYRYIPRVLELFKKGHDFKIKKNKDRWNTVEELPGAPPRSKEGTSTNAMEAQDHDLAMSGNIDKLLQQGMSEDHAMINKITPADWDRGYRESLERSQNSGLNTSILALNYFQWLLSSAPDLGRGKKILLFFDSLFDPRVKVSLRSINGDDTERRALAVRDLGVLLQRAEAVVKEKLEMSLENGLEKELALSRSRARDMIDPIVEALKNSYSDRKIQVRVFARRALEENGRALPTKTFYEPGTLNHDLEEDIYKNFKLGDLQNNEPIYSFMWQHGGEFFSKELVSEFKQAHSLEYDHDDLFGSPKYPNLRREIVKTLYDSRRISWGLLNYITAWEKEFAKAYPDDEIEAPYYQHSLPSKIGPKGAKDEAMNGGIDIRSIDVKHKEGSARIRFYDDAVRAVLKDDFSGFTPVIINITPIQSPLPLLGIGPAKKTEVFSKDLKSRSV